MTEIRWMLLAFVVAGLAACSSDDGGLATDTTPKEPTTTAASITTELAAPAPASFEADASLLSGAFVPLDAGAYRVDTVGTPFSFTTEEPLFVQPNGGAMFTLTDPNSNGPDDRDIVILRLSTLVDPTTQLASVFEDVGSGWPASDFSGWLDNSTDEVLISNRDETTLGGLDAVFAELELGDTDCTFNSPCSFGTNHQLTGKALVPGSTYRVWIVDQGDEDPLAVIVGINREAELDWFNTADDILATLAFGSVGRNPVFETAGEVELDFLGGIRTELGNPAVVVEEPQGYGAIAQPGEPGDTEFLSAPNDTDGNSVETSDDLLALLEDGGVEVAEIEGTEIDGFEARVFEIGSPRGRPMLTRSATTEAQWTPPPRGRMWVVEHPDRGLQVITAEAFTNPDVVFPTILAQTEPIIESMEFVELG